MNRIILTSLLLIGLKCFGQRDTIPVMFYYVEMDTLIAHPNEQYQDYAKYCWGYAVQECRDSVVSSEMGRIEKVCTYTQFLMKDKTPMSNKMVVFNVVNAKK